MKNHPHKPRLCILTTVSISIKSFCLDQIRALQQAGFDVTVICAPDPELPKQLPEGVDYRAVEFSRVISPFKDIKAVVSLLRIFRRKQFDIVQYSTPKASLLAAIAARLARIPHRLYLLWGLYYMGVQGMGRVVLKVFEKIICRLSTEILPISMDMVDFAKSQGLVGKTKCSVILNGSACGVDLSFYNPDRWAASRDEVRKQWGISADAIVIGTVARLTGDKGINELVGAFDNLSQRYPNLVLLLVGTQEQKDRLGDQTMQTIQSHPRIKTTGWQTNPAPFYAAMDIFCLPTYREGFGEVNLEAQAMGLPVVSTDVIGPRESVEQGRTGFLVSPQSQDALLEPLTVLIESPECRRKMGQEGRKRVENMFERNKLIQAMLNHRLSLLSSSVR